MKIYEGDTYREIRKISDEDVLKFAELSLDYNPIHFDDEKAEDEGFPKKIVHGMLVGSFFSKIIGTELPGDGTIYVSQKLEFVRPVFREETLEVVVKVEKYLGRKRFLLSTNCYNYNSELVVKGYAEVLAKKYEE